MLEHLARMPADVVLDLAGITYSNSLVYSPDVASTVRTDITLNASGEKYAYTFTISSYTTGGERQLYCIGVFDVRGSSERASKLTLASTMVQRRGRPCSTPALREYSTRAQRTTSSSRISSPTHRSSTA
ncbi:hypothetical protein A0H81_05710 [Grifola frondosa]|uniref:Uncharacterized protein n=1 Tax=Grifola frondosa TaxID=5627 RepID=A0A1C7MBT4_GRIFR|nr:hypothetical protein A0H81_05710 [Grifola frondosa]